MLVIRYIYIISEGKDGIPLPLLFLLAVPCRDERRQGRGQAGHLYLPEEQGAAGLQRAAGDTPISGYDEGPMAEGEARRATGR